jgi:hypothetical protein
MDIFATVSRKPFRNRCAMIRGDDLQIISAVQRKGRAGFGRFRELVRRGTLFTK